MKGRKEEEKKKKRGYIEEKRMNGRGYKHILEFSGFDVTISDLLIIVFVLSLDSVYLLNLLIHREEDELLDSGERNLFILGEYLECGNGWKICYALNLCNRREKERERREGEGRENV